MDPLVVNNATVHVELMRPLMYLPDVQGPFEECIFLLSGISPKCTSDDVKAFVSIPDVGNEIERVIFTQQPGVAMLQFSLPVPGNQI